MKYLVVSASPVILLGKIGRLSLLKSLKRSILVTPEVAREVGSTSPEAIAMQKAIDEKWISIMQSDVSQIEAIVKGELSKGEMEVIALSLKLKSEGSDVLAVLDDKPARHTAEALGISITGTLGIIIYAARVKQISSQEAIECIEHLLGIGARLDPLLVRRVIREIENA